MGKINRKKIYSVPNVSICFCLLCVTCFICVILSILWLPVIIFSVPLLLLIFLFGKLLRNPKYITKKYISVKGHALKWENVIIAIHWNSIIFVPNTLPVLVFGDAAMTDEDKKQKCKEGWYVILTAKNLDIILPHYNKPIVVCDDFSYRYNRIPAKCIKKIVEHNSKFNTDIN